MLAWKGCLPLKGDWAESLMSFGGSRVNAMLSTLPDSQSFRGEEWLVVRCAIPRNVRVRLG